MDATQQLLSAFANVSVSGQVLTSDLGTPRTLIAAKANFSIVIQRIVISITTDATATLAIADTAGTPVPIFSTAASPGLGVVKSVDFGPIGFVCTDSKGLTLTASATGLAFVYVVQAYQKRTSNSFVTP